MAPPGTFERVYTAIKRQLREGVFRPGDRLEPAVLCEELNSSVTPVRDALHRLAGERLVEAPRHEGFRMPMLTEATLRQMYDWHLDLLILALMKRIEPDRDFDMRPEGAPDHEWQNIIFRRFAQACANPEHQQALATALERLEPARRLEGLFLDSTATETEEIVRAMRSADRPALRRSLIAYHRRRQRIVPELLARLQRRE
jgi:DNA-binding transcriptional MocR family regulator